MIATRDHAALERAIADHESLIAAIAARFRGLAPWPDLMQAGRLGFAQAWPSFDPGRGCRISTHAYRYVLRACHEAAQADRPGHIPRHVRDSLDRTRKGTPTDRDLRPVQQERVRDAESFLARRWCGLPAEEVLCDV